jgi:hypothetical protein
LNNAIQLEDKVSRSRSKHEGESSAEICDRLSRTRVRSQRQLPTDHDYAVPTREYQLDQSSPLPATAAADPVLDRKKRRAHLDRSLHINVRIADNPPSCRLLIPSPLDFEGSTGSSEDKIPKHERDRVRRDLLDYCHLYALAMVSLGLLRRGFKPDYFFVREDIAIHQHSAELGLFSPSYSHTMALSERRTSMMRLLP